MSMNRKEFLSIPNILSYFRIVLIPIFIWRFITATEPAHYYIAAFIIFLSGLTDFLDGQIARRYRQVTEFGKALDPIADKLTQAGIIFCLMLKIKWMFLLVILFVVKELFMGIASLVIIRKKRRKLDGAKWFGKICTAVFYFVTFVLIAVPELSAFWVYLLLAVCAAFMLLSFSMYVPVFVKMYRADRESSEKKCGCS